MVATCLHIPGCSQCPQRLCLGERFKLGFRLEELAKLQVILGGLGRRADVWGHSKETPSHPAPALPRKPTPHPVQSLPRMQGKQPAWKDHHQHVQGV